MSYGKTKGHRDDPNHIPPQRWSPHWLSWEELLYSPPPWFVDKFSSYRSQVTGLVSVPFTAARNLLILQLNGNGGFHIHNIMNVKNWALALEHTALSSDSKCINPVLKFTFWKCLSLPENSVKIKKYKDLYAWSAALQVHINDHVIK